MLTAEKCNGVLHAQFPRPYRLRGDWEVGISTCIIPSDCWMLCDLVDHTHVNNDSYQVVDYIQTGYKCAKAAYVKLTKRAFSSINVMFKEKLDKDELLTGNNFVCILHFRKA